MFKHTITDVRSANTLISENIHTSLSNVLIVCMKKANDRSYPKSVKQRLWSDWADAKVDICMNLRLV